MKTQCTQYGYREELPASMQTYYQGGILHTAVLKWALRNEWITTAIPGFTTFEQMEQDFSVALNLEYSMEEQKFLQARGVKFSLNYCRQCSTCRLSCPRQVDLPNLMRVHLYATCYANFDQARQTLQEIKPGHGLEQCIQCSECVARCPHQIKIARRITELRQIYA
jgi:predicted aldo/keto reductase-like oxidoreductase